MKSQQKGFTTLEAMTSIALFVFIILLTGSMYSLSQKSYKKGTGKAELIQNARVSLDIISRELRQSIKIITYLPETNDNPVDPPSNEIFFQDGHDISEITYLRYYLDNEDLKRAEVAYYFETSPDLYVEYGSLDNYGESPEEIIIEDVLVGEYFEDLQFWGDDNLINISMSLGKENDFFDIQTSVFVRN